MLRGETNEQKIWLFLKEKIGNEKGVAGLMGNLHAESALSPINLQNTFEKSLGMTDTEYTKAVDNGTYKNFVRDRAGYGIAQWTYWTRKQRLYDYCKSAGASIGSLEAQLNFLWKELEGSYGSLIFTLKNAKSVQEASNAVLFKYERPADQGFQTQKKRTELGEKIYERNGTKSMEQEEKQIKRVTVKKVFMTNSPFYKQATKLYPKGLMLHSVGCPQPKAMVFINQWNKSSFTRASVHGFIDANDGVVYQSLPWGYRAPHCGGSANNTHIGVEMCEPSVIKYVGGSVFKVDPANKQKAIDAVLRVYDSAVLLFAELALVYKIDPSKPGAIISHREGNKLGMASNHGDPEHLWNNLGLPLNMNTFRQDVIKAMKGWYIPRLGVTGQDKPIPDSFAPFVVRVEVPALNIRESADTDSAIRGVIKDKGSYTIVALDKTGKWGKLKSGEGWIFLQYTKRI